MYIIIPNLYAINSYDHYVFIRSLFSTKMETTLPLLLVRRYLLMCQVLKLNFFVNTQHFEY